LLPKALLPRAEGSGVPVGPGGERGPVLVPRYLREDDHPWLRALIDVYRAHAGRPRRALDERLREPLPVDGPPDKRARAIHVMDRLCRDRVRAPVRPRTARAVVFAEAARLDAELQTGRAREEVEAGTADPLPRSTGPLGEWPPGGARADATDARRTAALRRAATELEVEPDVLAECLFADLPGERRMCPPPDSLEPGELALRTNLALVEGLVGRSARVEVTVFGNARDLVRHARLRGLLCTVRPAPAERAVLELSGPFALFRRTLVYGRALASLVPRLPWCDDFELRADYVAGERPRTLLVRPGDPIFPAREPRRFDSKLEARFARDFERAAPDWQLTREPRPVRAGDALIFPDFAVVHRRQPDRRWLLEIVGFWTEAYLADKLRRLEQAGLERLVLCVDADRACGRADLPAGARVIPFRRRIDPGEVLRVLDEPEG